MRRFPKVGPILLFLPVLLLRSPPRSPAAGLPALQLQAGTGHMEVEVAATLESRMRGLMFRDFLPEDRGMLFVFPEAHTHCMWMKNTFIPLSAAFLDGDGTIVNIAEMQADTIEYHCASKPVRQVLETNRGWLRKKGAGVGSRVTGLEKVPAGQ